MEAAHSFARAEETDVLSMVLPYLPSEIGFSLEKLSNIKRQALEEIRLNLGCPLLCRFHDGEAMLAAEGRLCYDAGQALPCDSTLLRRALLLVADSSLYAFEEELRRGYITLPGGHRVGIVGRVVTERGEIKTIKEISALNFRLARPIYGRAAALLPYICNIQGELLNTLILSPPRAGKTTLLRDLAYDLAEGLHQPPVRVGIVDERSEIAAMRGGRPGLPVGLRSDVLDGCPKAEGMLLLLRSMSPQVLLCDELGKDEDALALREASNAGVAVIATAHAADYQQLAGRPLFRDLLRQESFQRFILLSRRQGPGTVEHILDRQGRTITGVRLDA